MKVFKLILIILVVVNVFGCASLKDKREETIMVFLEDVYFEKNTNEFIWTEYSFLDKSLNQKKHKKLLIWAFKHLREKIEEASNKKEVQFDITKYEKTDLNGLIIFRDEEVQKNAYVVKVNSKVVTYILMEGNKIKSFNTFQKGKGDGYFI